MKKIPCLFQRDFTDRRKPVLLEIVTPGCEWVLAGEGVATRKWDGTACMIRDGKIYARYDAKKGKTPPPGAIPCEPEPDSTTGHWPHWVLAEGPAYQWHQEAFAGDVFEDGTYELVGPKINGNPENMTEHRLIRHGVHPLDVPRDFTALGVWLSANTIEGIVFYRPYGEMVKIRRDDYGLSWPIKEP